MLLEMCEGLGGGGQPTQRSRVSGLGRVASCPTNHREMKSMACRRGSESRSSSSPEVFWASRLMPSHLTSLSVEREWGGGQGRNEEGPGFRQAQALS